MAEKILFDRAGIYLLGSHRGTHVSKLPPSYIQWASVNISGFQNQYTALARGEELPKPAVVKVQAEPQHKTGRRYFISRIKQKYQP